MKSLLVSLLAIINLSIAPVLSCVDSKHELEKCNDNYCPHENLKDKKENSLKDIPAKK